jgi:hypothetical protein
MKKILVLLSIALVFSCGKEQHDFTLKGHVKGLKKGTFYLQKQQDSIMVIVDSLEVNGSSDFELHSNLEAPQILFLKLDKNDLDDGRIAFFADKGITEINTTLKSFNFDAKIKGSKQQETLEEYLSMMSKFNDKNLDLIKERFDAQKANDTTKSIDLDAQYNSLLKRKYLYTINFAINNKDSEVAPYLALTEIPNTSVKFLENIYDALDDTIKSSMYGTKLKTTIEERKKE